MFQSEDIQVNGIHIINNMEGLTMKHASHIGPSIAKAIASVIQVWAFDCISIMLPYIFFSSLSLALFLCHDCEMQICIAFLFSLKKMLNDSSNKILKNSFGFQWFYLDSL